MLQSGMEQSMSEVSTIAPLGSTATKDVLDALTTGLIPEEYWDVNDDRCDCVFQRVGLWTNPYLGETLEVRMCCIWQELYQLFPQHVRMIPAFWDDNVNEWVDGLREWDGESDMPQSIWYRQMARKEGISVSEARDKYADRDDERPRGRPRPSEPLLLTRTQLLALEHLQQQIQQLEMMKGEVLQEAGLDPGKVYDISPEGLVTEVTDASVDMQEVRGGDIRPREDIGGQGEETPQREEASEEEVKSIA